LGLIGEKLSITQGSTIALNVLVMNLENSWRFFYLLYGLAAPSSGE
jgi:hypothetical protein